MSERAINIWAATAEQMDALGRAEGLTYGQEVAEEHRLAAEGGMEPIVLAKGDAGGNELIDKRYMNAVEAADTAALRSEAAVLLGISTVQEELKAA